MHIANSAILNLHYLVGFGFPIVERWVSKIISHFLVFVLRGCGAPKAQL